MNGSRNIYTKSDVRESCSGIATISRSAVLVLCQAPSHTPTASVHQFAAMKTLSLPKCVHDHPVLCDRHDSFRSVVSDQRQSPPDCSRFLMLPRQRNLRADCILVSSTPASRAPTLPTPSLADLHSTTAG